MFYSLVRSLALGPNPVKNFDGDVLEPIAHNIMYLSLQNMSLTNVPKVVSKMVCNNITY